MNKPKPFPESAEMDLVLDMHEKFDLGGTRLGFPKRLTGAERIFRVACMGEELLEFNLSDSLVDDYDAIIDLIVFCMGTLACMNMPLRPGFERVMSANMAKQPGTNNKRGNWKKDLVKPEGWVPPDAALLAIINEAERRATAKGSPFNKEDHDGEE